MRPDIVGLLVMEQSGVTSTGGAAPSISELLENVRDELIRQSQDAIADGGILKFQIFELGTGDVLFDIVLDFKKPFTEIIKFQPV